MHFNGKRLCYVNNDHLEKETQVAHWVTTNDNQWQRVAISANSSFFRIREESITKHPKENTLNLKEDLEEKGDIELRAERSP